MKKGKIIPVSDGANYDGPDMDWTEAFTGYKTIGEGGEWVCHVSETEIKEFRAKKICVTPSLHIESYFKGNATKAEVTAEWHRKRYIYSIFLPEGTEVETYSDDEYRIELTEEFKVVYSGQILTRSAGIKKDSCNRQIYQYLNFCDTVKPTL